MKLSKLLLVVPLLSGCASNAVAEHGSADNRYSVDAPVVHVEPIYRTVRVEQPRRECWDEETYVERPGYRSHTGTILGGIVGGVLGHQIGGHHGGLATAAGTVLGASVGRDLSGRRRSEGGYYDSRERCEVRHEYTSERRIENYRVTYAYAGREHVTYTDYEPGDRIRVRVAVQPQDNY